MFSVGEQGGNRWYIGLVGKEGYFSLQVMNKEPMTVREAKAIEAAALKRAGDYPKSRMWVCPRRCPDDDFMDRVYANIAAKNHWAKGIS